MRNSWNCDKVQIAIMINKKKIASCNWDIKSHLREIMSQLQEMVITNRFSQHESVFSERLF